jgi:excisionase family DNA binding protein
MTSRSSMSAQRRHPRHPDDSASASWSARSGVRTPRDNSSPALNVGARSGGHIVNTILTSVEGTAHAGRVRASHDRPQRATLPVLLTVDEAADLLRTTRRAIYAMIERRQLPGVIRIRRRVLLRADDLLHWLDQKRAPSSEE